MSPCSSLIRHFNMKRCQMIKGGRSSSQTIYKISQKRRKWPNLVTLASDKKVLKKYELEKCISKHFCVQNLACHNAVEMPIVTQPNAKVMETRDQ